MSLLSINKACTQTTEKTKEINNKNISMIKEDIKIKEVLKSQLEDGESFSLGGEFESHNYSEKDLDAIVPIIKQELENNNYKFLNTNEFSAKIRNIFNRIIDPNSSTSILYLNFNEKCDRDPIYTLSPIYSGIFVIKKENFITDLYAIPQIIDYQKMFTDLVEIENQKILKKEPDLGQEIEIPHWKDVPNLKETRKKNIQTVVARNMYLFNDNKSQFKWLILNDQYFMESLVKTFGYTQDLDLLKWVIERTRFNKNNQQDYGKLFWTKQCDGTLKIHANTFKMLQQIYQPNDYSSENRFILDDIKEYLKYLGDKEKSENENLTLTEKLKIMANLTYFAEQYKYDKRFVNGHGSKMMGRLRHITLQIDGEKILEENNYFNLPKFKEWWDNADYDEYVVGGEYDGEWGTSYRPISESEWRKQDPKK